MVLVQPAAACLLKPQVVRENVLPKGGQASPGQLCPASLFSFALGCCRPSKEGLGQILQHFRRELDLSIHCQDGNLAYAVHTKRRS